jgi:hypothetical protein
LESGAKPGFLPSAESAEGAVPGEARRRREAPAGAVDGAEGAGAAGAAAGAEGSFARVFPRNARLARELGGFGNAAGSTGLVILSVIRAMGMGGRRG